MHSDRLSKQKAHQKRRKALLQQLATSLSPAWVDNATPKKTTMHSTSASASTSIRTTKRIRKTVERYNPTSIPTTQKQRSTAHSSKASSRKNKRSSDPKPRTPSRQVLQRKTHEQLLDDAAHSSRLHARGLCPEEFELFQYHLGRSDLKSYLKVRNTMLWLWRESPSEPLTLAKAFEATKDHGLHHGLIAHVFEFLLRSGYINFGACAFQEDAQHLHESDLSTTQNRKTVVVIGTGISGIAAARQLENLFHYYSWRFAPDLPPKVILLEARSRVGGRMHSMELDSKLPSSQSISFSEKPMKHFVDLGAQIITGFENGNPMEIIIRRQLSNLKLHYLTSDTCDLFGHDGKPVSKTLDVHCETVFNDILDKACQLRDEEEIPPGLKTYLKNRSRKDSTTVGGVQSITHPTLGHSMDYFMKSHKESPSWTHKELGLIHWHSANLEFANATPLDQLSLRYWDQDDDYEFSGNHSMIVQGYGQLPNLLSEGLDVRLDMPVTSIVRSTVSNSFSSLSSSKDHNQEPVQVHCRNGEVFHCTAALITVPLGVLKTQQIKFSPSLPTWKEQSIKNLGFGLLNKLVLVFEKSFWDPKAELFGYVASGKDLDLKAYRSSRGKFYMFWNCTTVAGLPVLVTLMAGQSAYDCENIPKETLVQEALETLGLIFSHVKPIPKPIETIVTRWSQDEFAKGSYSFVAREATGEDYDQLAKPVDEQLYFAGEATSRHYPATAHGAYLSGLKAAKDILDSLIGAQVVDSGHESHHLKRSGDRTSNDEDSGNETSSRSSPQPHLISIEEANDSDSPCPSHYGPDPISFMSLGHGFVVPRRRGRVCRSLIAEFVAQRSDSEYDSDSDHLINNEND